MLTFWSPLLSVACATKLNWPVIASLLRRRCRTGRHGARSPRAAHPFCPILPPSSLVRWKCNLVTFAFENVVAGVVPPAGNLSSFLFLQLGEGKVGRFFRSLFSLFISLVCGCPLPIYFLPEHTLRSGQRGWCELLCESCD